MSKAIIYKKPTLEKSLVNKGKIYAKLIYKKDMSILWTLGVMNNMSAYLEINYPDENEYSLARSVMDELADLIASDYKIPRKLIAIGVPEELAQEVVNYGDEHEGTTCNFDMVNYSLSLAKAYIELTETYPNWEPNKITIPNTDLNQMMEYLKVDENQHIHSVVFMYHHIHGTGHYHNGLEMDKSIRFLAADRHDIDKLLALSGYNTEQVDILFKHLYTSFSLSYDELINELLELELLVSGIELLYMLRK